MRTKFDLTVQTNTEEVLDKAGWMYADLFLALMVIFLATISFVPSLTKLPNTASGATTSSVDINKLNLQNGLVTTYTKFSVDAITKDVIDFKTKQHIPANAKIIYTQIIGGYDSKKESANIGTVNAISFSIKLRDRVNSIFGKSAISIDTSKDIPSGSVAIRSTFATS